MDVATPEQAAEGTAIVNVLAAVLDKLVLANCHHPERNCHYPATKFHAMKPPGIAIQQYLERIHKYAFCSNECFVLALIYIDRLIQRNSFVLTELNVHRVVITSILLAAKFFDDAYYNNAYYAKVGGVTVAEMNGLEVDFLFRINFSLHVPPPEFEKYKTELLSHSTPLPQPVQISPELHGVAAATENIPVVYNDVVMVDTSVKMPAPLPAPPALARCANPIVMVSQHSPTLSHGPRLTGMITGVGL